MLIVFHFAILISYTVLNLQMQMFLWHQLQDKTLNTIYENHSKSVNSRRLFFILLIVLLVVQGCGSKTKEALYDEGLKEQKKSNYSGAAVLFKSALEKDFNYQDARFQLAKSYMASGKYELAEKEFRKVGLQSPSRQDIPLELARIYVITRKPELAIKEAGKLPATAETLELLGVAYLLINKPAEGETCLRQALELEPNRASTKIELAGIDIRQGRNADARQLLNEAIQAAPKNFRAYNLLADLEMAEGRKDKALEIYEKAAQANPADPSAPYKSGLLFVEKGDFAKAGTVAADLSSRFARFSEGTRLQGIIKYHTSKYSDAIPLLQKSIGMRAAPEAYYYLGLCYYNQGDLELALSQFRIILDHNPSALQPRLLTGIILLKQKRVVDSIAEIKKLLQYDEKHALAHNILGSAYMAMGMYDEGMKELNRALELDPKIIDAHLKKGVFYFKKGQMKEAESALVAAVQVAPELLNSRLLLAAYYTRRNNNEKAMAQLKQGVSGKKADAVLYNSMAGILFARNKRKEGLDYLVKAKAADPGYLTACFNLAVYYAASDEYEKSLQEYRDILVKRPDNVRAMLSLASLFELKGRESEALEFYNKAKALKNGTAYLALATYHLKKKDNKKALLVLDDAIAQISRNIDALEMKARIFISEKKFKEALAVYNEIYSFNPDLGFKQKVSTYMLMKEAPKALEETRQYIVNKPNLAFGHILQSAVYESQNNLAQALDSMQRAVRAEPGNPSAHLALGNIYLRKGDRKSAADFYEKALHIDSEFLPALFAQGLLLETGGNKKGAVQKYREILGKSETFMPAINNLAYIYIDDEKTGSPKEGLMLAFSAFKLAPENPAAMDTLGYALIKNGRSADAVKLLEKAAALLPGDAAVAAHLAMAKKGQAAEPRKQQRK